MVRRWSYLNQINISRGDSLPQSGLGSSIIKSHHQVTFKATTYYRKPLYNPLVTKITRKSFFRRKHLNSWIIYQNILTLWAKEYLFFRKYSRTLLAFFFFKTNILMYNVLIYSNLAVDKLKGLENFHLTHLVRSVSSFCYFKGSLLFPFFGLFKNFSFFFGSTNLESEVWKKMLPMNLEQLYTLTPLQLSPDYHLSKRVSEVEGFFRILFQNQISYHVEVYKFLILLLLTLGKF